MRDFSAAGIAGVIVKADAGSIQSAGEILPPRSGQAENNRPHLAAGKGIPFDEFQPGDSLYEMAQKALGYVQSAQSPATARAYDSDFRLFVQ
jgi:hypothetical protein